MGIDVAINDIDKRQVSKPSVSCKVKSDENRLYGNSSIKAVMLDAKKCHFQSHGAYAAIKVCNRFEPLSWVVNDALSDPNAGVSNDSITDVTMDDNNNCIQKYDLVTENDNESVSMDYTSTADILKQVQKGKNNACMRRVEVEKIKDKCLDLKICINQQNTVFGFLPITNLKRTKINTSLRPNCVLTEDKFDPVLIHTPVRKMCRYNFEQANIQLPSKINFDLLEQLSSDYWDYQLKSFLKFGLPLDFLEIKKVSY